ncbi:DUF4262 domain-containing protein [Nocardia brasiliensis]|uniref:DUF4262 domain-containing protein n=1 Tax=Nocardia brasiliensis TaxID=37326 RepID=UPI00379D0B2F
MSTNALECQCVLCHDHDVVYGPDQRIVADVQQHGWHVVKVLDEDLPAGFAYTVGLSHTHGTAELAMFGLDVRTLHVMLNTLGALAAAGTALHDGDRSDEVIEGRSVLLREIDSAWYPRFFGRALAFHRNSPCQFLQVNWPDAANRFHWDEQAAHRATQPSLWLRPDDHPDSLWTSAD